MRVGHLNVTRPMPWDRTPTVTGISIDQVSGLNGTWGTIATYTCPSNKKAYIDAIGLSSYLTGADPAGNSDGLRVRCTPSGGSALLLLSARMASTTIGNHFEASISDCGMVTAGATVTIEALHTTNSTSADWLAGVKITQFDA